MILSPLTAAAATAAAASPLVAIPIMAPDADANRAAAVTVTEQGESLVTLPSEIPQLVHYNSLPLPPRETLCAREGVVVRLQAARRALPEGFDLVVLDAWRSLDFQSALRTYYLKKADVTTDYVAASNNPALRPGHTTGGALDVTLSWAGVPLALGTDYDDFTPFAHPEAFEKAGSDLGARDLRRLLVSVMVAAGFAPYPYEWWHFSRGDQWWAVIADEPVAVFDTITHPKSRDRRGIFPQAGFGGGATLRAAGGIADTPDGLDKLDRPRA